jgi:phenylalanyl-tRNA synthetase beta chain
MNVSYAWLRSLVPGLTDSPAEVADRLAMQGAPVDELVDLGGPLSDIIIARVLEVRQHPNADRLKLCRVDAGTGEPLAVVCGANNVRAEAWYPFIPAGATLPDGTKIRRTKIRGEESNGMLCSARELGLGRDHEGILELRGEFETGASFIEQVGLDDTRIVVDVTPNRGDLLSHWGIARELAPDGEKGIELPAVPGGGALADFAFETGGASAEAHGVQITLDDVVGCPRYTAAVIRGVKVGPSPEWLASRLRTVGLRPINNVVDATNWVLMELGQPTHAFDMAKLGTSIVVRRARATETLVTLDDVTRKLAPDVLVIADAEKPVALAGLMGGLDTEVTSETTDVLLECAHFDPKTVREGRRLLGMNTDAAYRFERGVDPDGMVKATRRVAAIIVATAGGSAEHALTADAGMADVGPVDVRTNRVVQVLGIPMDADEIASLIEPIGFAAERNGDGVQRVRIPGHRRYDVTREDDVIEEIARRRGYDSFPDDVRAFRASVVPDDPVAILENRLRERLVGLGFLESRGLPLVGEEHGDVPLLLPLATTESRLRRALLPGLARRIEANFSRGARDIRLFEIGTAFAPGEKDPLPVETTRLAVIVTGARHPHHWTGESEAFDIWDLRGLMEEIARDLGVDAEPGEPSDTARLIGFDPGTIFRLRTADGTSVGAGGRVNERAIDSPAWASPVWAAEVTLTAAMTQPSGVDFRPLPAHPAVERDVALLVPPAVSAGDISTTIRETAGNLLEAVAPFDLYEGPGLEEGLRSVAFRLRFRAADRTLTMDEVDARMARILERLESEHDVEQRG